MASRTIENDNDRRLTIMTATFVPCGAKLPVIALMGGIMTGWATGNYEAAGYIAPLMYFIGVAAVLVSAIILKKTKDVYKRQILYWKESQSVHSFFVGFSSWVPTWIRSSVQ